MIAADVLHVWTELESGHLVFRVEDLGRSAIRQGLDAANDQHATVGQHYRVQRAPRPQQIRGKLRLKAKAAKATRSDIAAAERQPDQTGLKRIAPSGEGYVRLRLRVEEDGGTSIVDGPDGR